jgi:hypothetical protein
MTIEYMFIRAKWNLTLAYGKPPDVLSRTTAVSDLFFRDSYGVNV